MATNYLNNLNYPVTINTSSITSTSNPDAIGLNSKRTRDDLNKLANYINSLLVPGLKSLASKPKYPYDAAESGISGMTIVTYPEELGNDQFNVGLYWKQDSETETGRPCTVKESFDYLLANIIDRVIEIKESTVDLETLWEQIRCNAANLERVQLDSLGSNYLLECKNERTRQWNLSKHIYEMLFQLTDGHEEADLTELNDGNSYPQLFIKQSILDEAVSRTKVSVHQDVNVDETSLANGQYLGWDATSNNFVNKQIDYNEIANTPEIGDTISSINELEGNINFVSDEGKMVVISGGELVAQDIETAEAARFISKSSNGNIQNFKTYLIPGFATDIQSQIKYLEKDSSWGFIQNRKVNGLSQGIWSQNKLAKQFTLVSLRKDYSPFTGSFQTNLEGGCTDGIHNIIGIPSINTKSTGAIRKYSPIVGISREDITFERIHQRKFVVTNNNSYVELDADFNSRVFYGEGDFKVLDFIKGSGESLVMVLGNYVIGQELIPVPFELIQSRTGILDGPVFCMSREWYESIKDSLEGINNFDSSLWDDYLSKTKIGYISNKLNNSEAVGSIFGGTDFGILAGDYNKVCSDILGIERNFPEENNTYYQFIEELWSNVYDVSKDKTNEDQREFIAKNSELSLAYAMLTL